MHRLWKRLPRSPAATRRATTTKRAGGIRRCDLRRDRASADDERPLFFIAFFSRFFIVSTARRRAFLPEAIAAIAVRKARLPIYRVTPCASERRTSVRAWPIVKALQENNLTELPLVSKLCLGTSVGGCGLAALRSSVANSSSENVPASSSA